MSDAQDFDQLSKLDRPQLASIHAERMTNAVLSMLKKYKADPCSPGNYYLAATRKEQSRISADGTLTLASIEIQSNAAPTEVLIFTAT